MALVFGLFWLLSGPVMLPPQEVWFELLATGLVVYAGTFWVQTFVQQCIPAGRTAVILTMEPVFAVLFGYWLAGNRLVPVQMAGAALLLSALVVGEVAPTLVKCNKNYQKGDVLYEKYRGT